MTIDEAVSQLKASQRGIETLRNLKQLLDNGGCGLDEQNWTAMLTLLDQSRDRPGSTLDAISDALYGR